MARVSKLKEKFSKAMADKAATPEATTPVSALGKRFVGDFSKGVQRKLAEEEANRPALKGLGKKLLASIKTKLNPTAETATEQAPPAIEDLKAAQDKLLADAEAAQLKQTQAVDAGSQAGTDPQLAEDTAEIERKKKLKVSQLAMARKTTPLGG